MNKPQICQRPQSPARQTLRLKLRLALVLATGAVMSSANAAPWMLAETLGAPDWLVISGQQRSRYETLDNQFRSGRNGGDQMLALRTALKLEANFSPITLGAELMDSRQALADSGTPINTTMVNSQELIQGYIAINSNNGFAPGSKTQLQLGRFTMDVGSRRLVARNKFRNTLNTFTGFNSQWQAAGGDKAQLFYVLPVTIMPRDVDSLLDNDNEWDEESSSLQLAGLYLETPRLLANAIPGMVSEFYLYKLKEEDSPGRNTANRDFFTAGLRFYTKPAPGKADFEVESVYQFGDSRASTAASDAKDLDHKAHFQHLQVGYTFAQTWTPRLIAQFDYASGDDDPNDGENNRFDTLYGARRFDFGPTGIYGAFARSNLVSPGYRLQLKPAPSLSLQMAHRYFWLASERDAWTSAGIMDSSGSSGDDLGQQIEVQFNWQILPNQLELETGVAQLFAGNFSETAPGANGGENTTYGYVQLQFTF